MNTRGKILNKELFMAFFREGEKTKLSYEECKNIYRNATMGKRVVEGLVNFAMSAEREIDVQKAPPEAIQKFKETAKVLKQEEAIKQTIYNARIYGTGGLYVAMYNEEEEKDDFTTKPTFEDAYKYKIRFNVLDPLNLSGSRVDNDPLSFHFLELVDIKVNTKTVPRKRISISHALEPLYLDNRTSLLPYTPPSVFYNMIDLLKEYDDAIKSIGDLLYKAGAIVYKYPAKSKLNGVFVEAQERSQIILQQKQSGEVISISADSSLEDFPISNLSGLIESINKLEDDITKALNDTPASILFDKSLSNGFSEGDKDKETEISIIESFRENKLTPLYNLTDYYVMLKAWDSAFIDDMRYKYSEYQDKTDSEIFRSWADNFTYQYGNLFPEPESITQDNNAKKLDNLLKVQQLGANIADIEEELNESEIFRNEMNLDNPPQMEDGGMEEEGDTGFDVNNILADARPIPPNTEWKTLDNGEHILVNEHGTIISGAGGNLKGKYFKNKDTGKFEKYTFNQQTLAPEAEREYNENKQKELEAQNNTSSEVKNISKTEYTQNRKDLVDLKDLLGFYQRELEQIHVNDKKNRAKKEEQINSVQQSIERKEAENKKYEETKKQVNKGDKESKEKPVKEKKIGKTYAIAYDNDTIEKLKSLGNTWQNKRIYFKELKNGSYDLVSEKWVTDSPEITKKALDMAGESPEDRASRLENEKALAEQKELEKRQVQEQAKKEKQAREKPYTTSVFNKIKDLNDFHDKVEAEMDKLNIYNGNVPKGSVNKITDALFTKEEQEAWKDVDSTDSDFQDLNKTYEYTAVYPFNSNLKELVYERVKSQLESERDRFKPLSWSDWLDTIDDTALDQYGNQGAWSIYGKEFEEYKKDLKRREAEYYQNRAKGIIPQKQERGITAV